jgi:glutamate-1-semialdehyde 2,1-aminomutase
VIKTGGAYHGWSDQMVYGLHVPGTWRFEAKGIPMGATGRTREVYPNDLKALRRKLAQNKLLGGTAAVIVEPIGPESGTRPVPFEFNARVRELCDEFGALLIFDEVITGFRHALGGYQAICGVTPDLSTFAKAIANGYPMAAVAGRRALLARLNTTATGDVTFAGTYNGGAISMAAALATIEVLETEPVHEHIFRLGERMRDGLRALAADLDVPVVVSGYGSLYVMLFMEGPLESYDDVVRNDQALFVAYRKDLVRRGILEMPENIGRNHIMYSHTPDDIDRALHISKDALTSTLRTRRQGHV